MLAAFPPPAHDRQSRGSWFRRTSWPLEPQHGASPPSGSGLLEMPSDEKGAKPQRRRCCGLPIWAFVLLLLVAIGLVAAAVLVPLEFFVFKNIVGKDQAQSELERCQASLKCLNGGTNVMSRGVCSCICTNGYTGSDCGTLGSDGCITTDIMTNQDTIRNVTLGKALPRLIMDAKKNFSIPLSGPSLMAKINSGSLSCIAQNSLVSFDGRATRLGEASSEVKVEEKSNVAARAVTSESVPTTLVVDTGKPNPVPSSEPSATDNGSARPTTSFTVTEEVLDFARVAVLYVLQEKDAGNAETAQSEIQRFLSEASGTPGVEINAAKSVDIGNQNSLDLVDYKVRLGSASVGKKSTRKRALPKARHRHIVRRGGPGVRKG